MIAGSSSLVESNSVRRNPRFRNGFEASASPKNRPFGGRARRSTDAPAKEINSGSIRKGASAFRIDALARRLRGLVVASAWIAAAPVVATPARADLSLCNMTPGRVGIALGYRDPQGWVTEGWWNLNARGCETLLKGPLAARFYYVYAVDYDRGGEWTGRSFMCTRIANSRSAASRIASPAASTGAASSRLIPANRRAGRSSSPTAIVPGVTTMTTVMRRSRRTKIIATLGPASESPEMIEQLFRAGADVFRLNMSHLPREKLRERVELIRSIEAKYKRPIAILADLQGPKLRVGSFENDSVMLAPGQIFTLDDNVAAGNSKRVHLPHPEILSSLEPGHTVLIDDGKLRLRVKEVKKGTVRTEVEVAGKISNRKGVSLPDTVIPVAAMTEKDRSDLEAALNVGVDWIALSFVQRPEDVAEVKKVARGRALVMSKLEKPQAIARLDEIMDVSDALMVARGDLGVEMPLEKVPGIQKRIVRTARRLGKPVVVATQMLESMITSPVPTRAEVSDVATAVYDGADAVMLSAESASGQYPVRCGRHHEPHRRGSRTGHLLLVDHHGPARRTGADGLGRDRGGCAPDRRHARAEDDRGLDLLRIDRLPDRPGAAEFDGDRADAEPGHGPPAGAGLGRPPDPHQGCERYRRHGLPGLQIRGARGLFQGERPHHHRRGRSVRHARRDQHGAHRLHQSGPRRPGLRTPPVRHGTYDLRGHRRPSDCDPGWFARRHSVGGQSWENIMTAYAVAHLRHVDMGPDIVAYLERIDGTLAPFDGRFVIHGGPVEPLEGTWSGALIMIAFPDRERARAWHASPAYQAILPLRTRNS